MARQPQEPKDTPSGANTSPRELERVFEECRSHLSAIAYRMTGSVQDANDVVQETFPRALERPPADTREPWLPWLVRIAVNLARDELRRRKRRSYKGPWLPAPLETEELASPAETPSPETNYDLAESATFA